MKTTHEVALASALQFHNADFDGQLTADEVVGTAEKFAAFLEKGEL